MMANESRCDSCRFYAKLEDPFRYDKLGYPEGVTVYGFCAKDINRLRSFYPVYLPDGGVCNDFKRKPGEKKVECPCDGQMSMEV